MNRSKSVRGPLVAIALASFVAANIDCARKDSSTRLDDTGAFRFSLKLSSLAEIDSVAYTVSGNGITPITGAMDVSSSNVAGAVISGLPAAMGYVVAATAVSTDGKTKCVGRATFAISDATETQASLILACTGPASAGTGAVRIDGTFDNCPVVTSITAKPSTAPVGGQISLIGTFSDLDGDPVTFGWRQDPLVGVFGSLTVARTTFTCTSPGLATLYLSVSDGTCGKAAEMSIACLSPQVDAATATDGPTGQGGAPGTGGVTGIGGAGAGGSPGVVGTTGVGGSGMGGTDSGDTGAGGSGVGGSGVGGSGVGGSGVGGSGVGGSGSGGSGIGGSGVGGTTGAGGSGTGGAMACTTPSHCDSLVCEQCTFGNKPGDPDLCDSSPGGCFNCDPATMGCELLTDPADRALCETLYACFVAPTHAGSTEFPAFCLGAGGDPLPCWCGTNALTCVTSNSPPTQANGPCLQQIFAAAKTTDAATISARFIDPAFPLGAAANLAICRGTFCAPECSLPK